MPDKKKKEKPELNKAYLDKLLNPAVEAGNKLKVNEPKLKREK